MRVGGGGEGNIYFVLIVFNTVTYSVICFMSFSAQALLSWLSNTETTGATSDFRWEYVLMTKQNISFDKFIILKRKYPIYILV